MVDLSLCGSRYVSVWSESSGVVMTLVLTTEMTLGSPRRERQLRSQILQCFKRLGCSKLSSGGNVVCAWFAQQSALEIQNLIRDIDDGIHGLLHEPLYPRVVEEMLGITASERIRWTKNGRLKTSGQGAFRRGQREIYFRRYSFKQMLIILRNIEIVHAWREEDMMQRQQH